MSVDPKFKDFGLNYLCNQFQKNALFLTSIKFGISYLHRQHPLLLFHCQWLSSLWRSLKEVSWINRRMPRANKEPRSFRTSLKYLPLWKDKWEELLHLAQRGCRITKLITSRGKGLLDANWLLPGECNHLLPPYISEAFTFDNLCYRSRYLFASVN